MLTHGRLRALWLLLLLRACGSTLVFNMFDRNPGPRDGDVRLFGSGGPSEGRVEVYHDGQWGTVCDDGWDMAEAQVVCRQLRFPGAKSVVIGKDYGKASGPIWLDDLQCEGAEDNLFTCAFKGWGVTDCSHKEDVGVICESNTNSTLGDSSHSLDHSINLSQDLGEIFDSGNDCDFLIVVRSLTGNKRDDGTLQTVETTVCAHRVILSQFPLLGASKETSNITIDVSQSCQPHFTSLVRYIYTRRIDVTFSSVQCLHWMASKFEMKQLMEDVGRLFSRVLPEDVSFHTQVSLYQYATEARDFVLQENCIQYLAWNYQNLTRSPAWTSLPVEVLAALLARSDLVVPDEYYLLQTVESWILERGNSSSLETPADLVSLVRFPMIPAEKLYELDVKSSLYDTHKDVYREKIMKALQFNVLLFSTLAASPKFRDDDDYQPRIYTAEPWSTALQPSSAAVVNPFQSQYSPYQSRMRYNSRYYPTVRPYAQTSSKSFSTPLHNSMIFKDKRISWDANVFLTQRDCSNWGVRCQSVPVAKLAAQGRLQEGGVIFRNRLLLMCQGKYICQVQDFKEDLAYIADNSTQALAYPCPDDQYTYRFVVRPEYVIPSNATLG